MAKSNDNNRLVLVLPLGSPSADALLPAAHIAKKSLIKSAKIMNGAALAASDTDFAQIELKAGATIHAEIDTRAAHENGLAQNVSKSMNISTEEIPAGTDLTINYNETDSGTAVALTNAVMVLELYQP